MTDVRSSGGSDVGVSSERERERCGRALGLQALVGVEWLMAGGRVAVADGVAVVVWCSRRNRRTEGHKGAYQGQQRQSRSHSQRRSGAHTQAKRPSHQTPSSRRR